MCSSFGQLIKGVSDYAGPSHTLHSVDQFRHVGTTRAHPVPYVRSNIQGVGVIT